MNLSEELKLKNGVFFFLVQKWIKVTVTVFEFDADV